MDRLFIDTNVIIDYLAARQPFDTSAKVLFQLAEKYLQKRAK
jgi:predicted nucleic acid-binding protein